MQRLEVSKYYIYSLFKSDYCTLPIDADGSSDSLRHVIHKHNYIVGIQILHGVYSRSEWFNPK